MSKFKILRGHFRVNNLKNSIHIYTKLFGMKPVTKEGNVLGFGSENDTAIELIETKDKLNIGSGYGHIALAAPKIYETCKEIEKAGGKVTRQPGPMKHGTTVIAFVEDDQGYKIELIQKENKQPLLHFMIRVGDLNRAKEFFTKVLGMKVLRENDFPGGKFTLSFIGYGDESENTVLELTYNYGVEKYDLGNAFQGITIATDDLNAFKERLNKLNVKMEGNQIVDPNGYVFRIVEDRNL